MDQQTEVAAEKVRRALGPIEEAFAADGYRLDSRLSDPQHIILTITPLDGACAECLIPEEILRPMVTRTLAAAELPAGDVALEIEYPQD